MLTISLHGISIQATRGMYAQEHKLYNHFETDVDVYVPAEMTEDTPVVDYTLINKAVIEAFQQPHEQLEHFIRDIHTSLKQKFPRADRIRITIRKLNPPMPGQAAYAQVTYEG